VSHSLALGLVQPLQQLLKMLCVGVLRHGTPA
jgi:hypothetical protein